MGSKGYWVGMAGGGGGACADPIGKAHVIRVDLDLPPPPLIPLTKFPGSAHEGGQFISLECIRTDCLMEDQARGVTLYQLGDWDWLKMMAFTWLDNSTRI